MTTKQTEDSAGWGETIKTVVYAILIAFGIRTVAFEPFNIPSGSMIPTLLVGDYLFVSKFSYGYSRYSLPSFLVWGDNTAPRTTSCEEIPGRIFGRMPERGEVAVFKLPKEPKVDYIKRIVGRPCDRVQVIGGLLHINGKPVTLEPLPGFVVGQNVSGPITVPHYRETLPNGVSHEIIEFLGDNGQLDDTPVFEVPPGYVFAMGDNRDNSLDSRTPEVGIVPLENLVGPAQFIFFSLEEGVRFWEVWKWPWAVRLSRMFQGVA